MAHRPRPAAVGLLVVGLSWSIASVGQAVAPDPRVFRAGVAAVDITPTRFPVTVNGSFRERTAHQAHDQLMARALVLDDGATRLAIVVVDSLMMPRALLDQVKETAAQATGIRTDHMLISATHTHSAPSVMACLGSGVDEPYQRWLPDRITEAIVLAAGDLTAARIGWVVVGDDQHNHCRRWIFRPDRMQVDPFGQRNVRAHMHPGHLSPDHVGPAGPADPDLTLLSVQASDGRPLAVLGNYAMHYYGTAPVSGDFCGRFCSAFAALVGTATVPPPQLVMMSQGTSGDSMWPDYGAAAVDRDLPGYTAAVARVAQQAYQQIDYRDWVPLAMAETTLPLRRREPDPARLEWARQLLAQLDGRQPHAMAEIYAREQVLLHQQPQVELKLQAIRIGDLGVTAIPCEVYGITGLKLKACSPLPATVNIELANGAEGYIPPPEQHHLGGYSTWPARTAGLEIQAEPKIVAALLTLLERVAHKPRRSPTPATGPYAQAVLASKPRSYWRMAEFDSGRAIDSTGHHHGQAEPGVVHYLPGPQGAGFATANRGNRAAHFAGGRVQANIPNLGHDYSVELWFWNALPNEARAVTGLLFSRGADGDLDAAEDQLGIGGIEPPDQTGKLIFSAGAQHRAILVGQTELQTKRWYHVVLTRRGRHIAVYLNGKAQPEISADVAVTVAAGTDRLILGGRGDGQFNFEGKLDEVAIYGRVLSADDVVRHWQAAGLVSSPAARPAPSSVVGSGVGGNG